MNFIKDPHRVNYFSEGYGVDETVKQTKGNIPLPIVSDKIVVNHYYVKSREEFESKVRRGSSARLSMKKRLAWFELNDRKDGFDYGIIKYRDARKEVYLLPVPAEDKNISSLDEESFPAELR